MNRSEVIKNFRTVTKAELETMHTKQLMKLLERSHSLHVKIPEFNPLNKLDIYKCTVGEWNLYLNAIECFQNKLKEILSTREHISNKAETKALRKAKIKKGK